MKKSFFAAFMFAMGLFVMAPFAYASSDLYIGVYTNKTNDTLKVRDLDGDLIETVALTSGQSNLLNEMSDVDNEVMDLIPESEGMELLKYNNKRRVKVYGQDGEEITYFQAFKKRTKHVIVATGDVSDEYEGDEIIVCHKKSGDARMKIYSYDDEAEEFTKISAFKTQEDTSDVHGCNNIAIGDIDGDDENEIVVASWRQYSRYIDGIYSIDAYDVDGERETVLSFDGYKMADYSDNVPLFVADMDGDGTNEVIYENWSDDGFTAIDNEGSTVYEKNDGWCPKTRYYEFSIGDVDADDEDELVLKCGNKKTKIWVYDDEGTLEASYKMFPNTKANRNRSLLLSTFDGILTVE